MLEHCVRRMQYFLSEGRVPKDADDISVFSESKRLGLFFADYSFLDRESFGYLELRKLGIRHGEGYIELHLPIVIDKKNLLRQANESLGLVGEYILFHDLKSRFIIGMTHPKLARLGTRFGFSRIQQAGNVEISGLRRMRYKNLANFNKNGDYDLLYYPRKDFLDKYVR